MFNCAYTARLSPDQRLGEIAAILAAGVLRMRQQAILPPKNGPQKPPLPGVEVPAGSTLTSPRRVAVATRPSPWQGWQGEGTSRPDFLLYRKLR